MLSVRFRAGYGKRGGTQVLRDVAFEIAAGERFGLVGLSGAGKSTLVLALLGLLPWKQGWAEGEVLFEGKNLLALREPEMRRLRGRRIALVPQSPMSALNGVVSLRTHFEQAWRAHEATLGRKFEERLGAVLEQVRLPADAAFLRRKPGAVSVGQAQRVVLALALLHRPALLIADEPTSALDPCTQAEVIAMLREVNRREGTSVLYISHDLLSVLRFCRTLAVLDAGSLVECLPVKQLSQGTRHELTAALIATLPAPLPAVLRHAEESDAEAVDGGRWEGDNTFDVFHDTEAAVYASPCKAQPAQGLWSELGEHEGVRFEN